MDVIRAGTDGGGHASQEGTWSWFVDQQTWDAGYLGLRGGSQLGELTALQKLLQALDTKEGRKVSLEVVSDSMYVINSVTKWIPGWKARGWKRKGGKISHLEVMKDLDHLLTARQGNFSIEWVRGHSGNQLNDGADELCTRARFETGISGPGFRGRFGPREELPYYLDTTQSVQLELF